MDFVWKWLILELTFLLNQAVLKRTGAIVADKLAESAKGGAYEAPATKAKEGCVSNTLVI